MARLGSIYPINEIGSEGIKQFDTHNFAVQEMFPDHDGVHTCGVIEREECEAP